MIQLKNGSFSVFIVLIISLTSNNYRWVKHDEKES